MIPKKFVGFPKSEPHDFYKLVSYSKKSVYLILRTNCESELLKFKFSKLIRKASGVVHWF